MKTFLIFASIILGSVKAYAERVTLTLAPGGAGCNHVVVQSTSGVIVGQISVDELRAQARLEDCSLGCQIKAHVINSTATTNVQIRNMLQQKEFFLQ